MRFREPLLIPLAAFAAGIGVSQAADFTSGDIFLGGGAALALTCAARWTGARRAGYAALLTAILFAGAGAGVWRRPGPPPQLDSEDGEVLALTGCVVEPSSFAVDREQFVLELEPGARARVSLAIKEGDPLPPPLAYGTRVKLEAKVRRPHNFENPGAFDYAAYLARQNIYWTASARGAIVEQLGGACGSNLLGYVYRIRVAALERIDTLYPADGYASAMLKAILLGDSTNLERVWTEQFRRTGTYHALVISGLHVIVLAGTLFRLLRMFLAGDVAAALIAAGGAWLYAAVSGWSAPVVRAAGGFTLYLTGRYFYRRGRVLNVLAAVAIVYLACDPGQLFEASFQLSFLSVAAIGAFAGPLGDTGLKLIRAASQGLGDVKRDIRLDPADAQFRVELRLLVETLSLWMRVPPRMLAKPVELGFRATHAVLNMVLLSAVIQVALALPMAVYFHRISVTGLTANLLVVPFMSLLVPVGFVAIFTGWDFAALIAKWLLAASDAVARWHVQFEPAHRVPDPPVWMALILVLTLIIAAMSLRFHSRWIAVALPAALIAFAVILAAPFPAEVYPDSLELTAIDVGQGDALMVTTPQRKVILVDGGGIPLYGRKRKPRLEIGEDVVSPYLWRRKIQRVDVIATTHAHEDHVGGLRALLENFRPAEIWTGALPEGSIESNVLDEARRMGVRVLKRTSGEAFDFGGARVEILSPAKDYAMDGLARNNDSLTFNIRYGKHSYLLMGDIEREVEWNLADRGLLAATTVLKVAHHGSKTSSTPDFLEATRPGFAVISAGYGNLFRHPHPEVLDRLRAHHTGVFRTDLDGLVTIRSDGQRITVDTAVWERSRAPFSQPFQSW